MKRIKLLLLVPFIAGSAYGMNRDLEFEANTVDNRSTLQAERDRKRTLAYSRFERETDKLGWQALPYFQKTDGLKKNFNTQIVNFSTRPEQAELFRLQRKEDELKEGLNNRLRAIDNRYAEQARQYKKTPRRKLLIYRPSQQTMDRYKDSPYN